MTSAVKFEESEINQAFDHGHISKEERDKLLADITPELYEDMYQESLVENSSKADRYSFLDQF